MLKAQLDTRQWERALRELGKKNAIKAGIRAINRTLTSSRSPVTKLVAADMGLQQKVVREQITMAKAKDSGQAPKGALYASAKKIPLIQFKAKGPEPSRGRGRGVSVKLPGGLARHPHSFIATMPNGNRGVYERTGRFKKVGNRMREIIFQKFGPSIYHVFQKHSPVAQARALETLDKNFQHEFDYLLSKAKQ